MPDVKLTAVQSKKLIEYLREKWPSARCPLCGLAVGFDVNTMIFEIDSLSFKLEGAHSKLAVAAATCENCSHTILFNLIHAKIVSRDELAPQQPKKLADGQQPVEERAFSRRRSERRFCYQD